MTGTINHPPPTEPVGDADTPLPLMIGCLLGLIALNVVQIAAGLSGIDVRPPEHVLPLIAATAVLGIAAVPMVWAGMRLGFQVGIGFCLLSMIGAGPHKLFLDDGIAIAPMALLGFVGEVVFIVLALRVLRRSS